MRDKPKYNRGIEQSCSCISYLIVSRPHQGIVTQVAANVSRDDFAIDAVARNKVLIHTSTSARCRRTSVTRLS